MYFTFLFTQDNIKSNWLGPCKTQKTPQVTPFQQDIEISGVMEHIADTTVLAASRRSVQHVVSMTGVRPTLVTREFRVGARGQQQHRCEL